MDLPSLHAIETLHRKYAPSDEIYELVYSHCHIVWRITEQIIQTRQLTVDIELTQTGCLLHDIGVYALYDRSGQYRENSSYITHGIEGERILRAEGMPERLWRIASHHTGVGLTKEEIVRENLPLPSADYFATTIEERLVMYADKFHSKSQPPHFNSYEYYRQHALSFSEANARLFDELAVEFGVPDLEPLAREYHHPLKSPM